MKKKKWMIFVLAACISGTFVQVEAAEQQTGENAVSEKQTEENTAEEQQTALSDDLYSFQLEYQGVLYQFPMAYSDLTDQGWELSEYEDPDMMVGTNSYTSVGFVKGDLSIRADIINFGINEAPVEECLIGGISIDEGYSDTDLASVSIVLPQGIRMGESTLEDIKAAYGEPSDTYEGDNYVKVTYERDLYQDIELYVYHDDQTLRQLSLRNFTEPEGFDKGTVSDEIPDIVASYEAPEKLGDSFMEPYVEYFGDLYTLPAPVSAFEANGWSILEEEEVEFVEGDGLAFVDMMKDNQTVRFTVYNLTQNAVTLENCFVTELKQATYDPEALSMKLSGDICLGADKSQLVALAEENGYLCEDDAENGYLTIYKNKENKLDTYLEVWFNQDESETAAAGLTYHNESLSD